MKILACQINIPGLTGPAERDQHVRRIADLISEQNDAGGGADLVLLPELATIDYSKAAFDNLKELAEGLDGQSVSVFGAVAKTTGAFICFGMPRQGDNGCLHISQVVMDPNGQIVGYYDKMHVAQFGASIEKPYFKPGRHLLIFDVAGVRVAPIICYDHRFPELTSTLCRDHGVDLILHPVAFYRDASFHSWHQFSITRAVENQIHLMSLNRAGDMYGGSLFSPPWLEGDHQPVIFGTEESCRILEVDMAYTRDIRAQYPIRADRIDNYATLPVRP